MRQFTQTVTATAGGITYSRPWTCDTYVSPFNIGLYVSVTGSAIYTVQHTFSDPYASDLGVSTNGTWLNHEFLTSVAVADDGNYAYPVRAIRLALASAAAATATINLIQAG